MTIERTPLPGIGVSHTLATTAGQRLGVIAHLTGRRDIVVYDLADPEQAACTVPLRRDEAHQISDLLDATVTIDHVSALERRINGITAARIRLPAGSPYDGRPLPDTRADALTGTSIVAVIHDRDVVAAPDPGYVLCHDDIVVAVGDPDGIAALSDLLTGAHADSA
ncbi:TrkA C-terminal domain-containing protein [Actinoplanes sp. NPDC049118]|uniref:cation:proton antiporter regulatory subunit n=1 Tax=Actinoplanes sp. NPDC049118 TaxID=3155769 RepID=UPI003404389A